MNVLSVKDLLTTELLLLFTRMREKDEHSAYSTELQRVVTLGEVEDEIDDRVPMRRKETP